MLKQAQDARNRLAHNQVVGTQAKRSLLETLGTLLAELRETTERTFGSAILVEPGPGEFDGEVNLFASAQRMTGHNPNFRKRPLASLKHLKARSLYLLEDRDRISDALEVAPCSVFLPRQTLRRARVSSRMAANEVVRSGMSRTISRARLPTIHATPPLSSSSRNLQKGQPRTRAHPARATDCTLPIIAL